MRVGMDGLNYTYIDKTGRCGQCLLAKSDACCVQDPRRRFQYFGSLN